jgi:cytochrome b
MGIRQAAETAGSATLPATPAAKGEQRPMVQVWDPLVRVFHWSLVGLFIVAYASGEDADTMHLVAGYGIVALLLLRVVWGVIGSPHARFSDFVRSPREVLEYMQLARQHRAPRYLGHNPAGGAMTIALMVALGGICLTGHLMTTTTWWGSKVMEHLHELLVDGTIGLIGLHLLGNLFSSRQHGENLTLSMITGDKRPQ